MQRWEYFTTTLSSSVEDTPIPVRDDIPTGEHEKYSPYVLIPQLNHHGDQGWELVSIEPVSIGRNGDVVRPDAHAAKWGRDYFCCFKRQIA
mgnify:CR=1 FL=1